jgi:hypothetical protein
LLTNVFLQTSSSLPYLDNSNFLVHVTSTIVLCCSFLECDKISDHVFGVQVEPLLGFIALLVKSTISASTAVALSVTPSTQWSVGTWNLCGLGVY